MEQAHNLSACDGGFDGDPTTTVVGGLPTARVTRKQLAQIMVRDCIRARSQSPSPLPKLVFSSNGQGIALANSDPSFYDLMLSSSLIHADGQSVVIASRLTKAPLPERIATTDFFHDAASAAETAGLSFFFLGASETQNAAAVEEVRRQYPSLRIAGRRHGYFTASDDADICEEIVRSGTDVLWVALGKPLQEQWCLRNRSRLKSVGWIKTCGGLFAFLSGDASRAPIWMQRLGFEWLHRASKEPQRLLFRYLTTNPKSIYYLLRYTYIKKY